MKTISLTYKDKRITYLDGLRGLLALIVFVHHFIFCFSSDYIIGGTSFEEIMSDKFTLYKLVAFTPLNLLLNSGFAVCFFFVLSGYVLSYPYFKNPNLDIVKNSLLKRYFRLAIPVLASCIIIWLLHRFHLFSKEYIPNTAINKDWLTRLFPDNLSFLEVVKYGLYDAFIGNVDYNTVLWTMNTELFGSFLLFVVLILTHKIKSKALLFLVIIFLQFKIGDTRFKAFSFGMLICYLQCNSNQFKKVVSLSYIKTLLVIVGLYLTSFPYVSYGGSLQKTMYRYTLFFQDKAYYKLAGIFGCTFLLLVLVNSTKLKTLFSTKPFLFLGKISFGLYLIHLCFIPVVSSQIYHLLYRYLYDYASIPITFAASFIFVIGTSYLFYKYIDVFAVKNASKISKFLFRYPKH